MHLKKLTLAVFLISLPICAQVNNSAIIYADQNTTLTYQQIVDTVCPTNGCTIYATSPNASRTIGTLDPGTKVVTIYLGPFTYNVDHMILRKGFRIIGMGASDAGTILQSTNTSNYPMFLLPQANNSPATDVYLYGFRLLAQASNTSQSGIWMDCSTLTNSGLWHSSFEDLLFLNFKGSAMGFFGPTTSAIAANQFLSFRNLWAIRPSGGGPDLRMEGYNAQVDCIECHFDGFGRAGDGWANIFLGNLSGGNYTPTSIHFVNLTAQSANIGVQLYGAKHITFVGSHHEDLNGAYQLQNDGTAGIVTKGVLISNAFFAGNVGNNGGNGFLVNAISASVITLQGAVIDGAPDFIVAGANAGNVSRY
jgi:hypothetical protein